MIFSTLIFLGVISLLVIVHELGHFLAAKFCKVGVTEFAVGFGNTLASFNDKNNTKWTLRAVPFGGFVGMLEEPDPKIPGKLFFQANYKEKITICASGPLFNILLAFLLTFSTVYFSGYRPVSSNQVAVSKVDGIDVGDVILTVDGTEVHNWKQVHLNLMNKPKAIVSLKKAYPQTQVMQVQAKPVVSETSVLGKLLGRKPKSTYKWELEAKKEDKQDLSISKALMVSLSLMMGFIMEFFMLFKLIGSHGLQLLSGPIGIAQSLSTAAGQGLEEVLWLTVRLSVSLGMFNLLPFPPLDGGQMLIATIEKIKGAPVSLRFLKVWSYTGFGLLISFMVYISLLDLLK